MMQREMIERLESFENSIKELLRLSEQIPERTDILFPKGMTYIYTTLTEDICRKCPKFRDCFGEYRTKTMDEIASVMRQACQKGFVEGQMASGDFRKKCIYYMHRLIFHI